MIEEHTALYSDLDRLYQQEYSGPYQDLSVKTEDGEIVVAIKDNKITGFGRPLVCFGTENFQLAQIERLWGVCPDIFYQDFLIDGAISPITKFLLKKGYRTEPYFTQIIDLTKTEEELHIDLRKSYTSLVHCSVNIGGIPVLRLSHYKRAGRKTRSDKTWEIQQQMIENFQAIVLHTMDSAALFYYNPISAYYAVSAGENGHSVIWRAIKEFKKINLEFLELGEQVFSGDTKEVNISHFKSGFGGICKIRLNLTKE